MVVVWLAALGGCSEYGFEGRRRGAGADTAAPERCARAPRPAVPMEDVGGCPAWNGALAPEIEWVGGIGRHSFSTPVVADLDGDGRPEVVTGLFRDLYEAATLVAFAGDGSGTLWEVDRGMGNHASPAVADLDGDGRAEVVVVEARGPQGPLDRPPMVIAAYEHDGALRWTSAEFAPEDLSNVAGPVIADMDGDGAAEIVAGRVILRADGSTRGVGGHGQGASNDLRDGSSGSFIVADLDGDGIDEVLTGNAAYTPDGATLWTNDLGDGAVSVVDLDGDGTGEAIVTFQDSIRAQDRFGGIVWGPLVHDAAIVSLPAIGDLDGDGGPELVFGAGSQLVALDADGTELWSIPTVDRSGATGPVLFDFDDDGLLEVVYADEVQLLAVAGADGAVRVKTLAHQSRTGLETPSVADVDGDGEAELLVAQDGGAHAFTVYGSGRDATWPPAGRAWNQHAWATTNIDGDLTVPRDPVPSFRAHNTFRAVPPPAAGLTNLRAEILDVCEDCDRGAVWVEARVVNDGGYPVDDAVPLSVYAMNEGLGVIVETVVVEGPLAAGWASASVWVRVDAGLAMRSRGFTAVANDDGMGDRVVAECRDHDNAVDRLHAACGGYRVDRPG